MSAKTSRRRWSAPGGYLRTPKTKSLLPPYRTAVTHDLAEVRHRVLPAVRRGRPVIRRGVRTHAEGLAYLYQVESKSLEIRKIRLRAIAFSPNWEAAVAELVAKRFWLETATGYRVVHHKDVFRQSLAAQIHKRERDKKAQQNKRARDKKEDDVSADVSADVIPDTDRQTDRQPGRKSSLNSKSTG